MERAVDINRVVRVLEVIDQIERSKGQTAQIIPAWIEQGCCPRSWSDADKKKFSMEVSRGIRGCEFSTGQLEEVEKILPILRKVVLHRERTISSSKAYKYFADENALRDDLFQYLHDDDQFKLDFNVDKEVHNPMGRCDIVLQPLGYRKRYVIELKVKGEPFDRQVDQWAAQTLHYASASDYARIGIFYCQCKSDDPIKDIDLIAVRTNRGSVRSPLGAICIAIRSASSSASTPSLAKRSIQAPTI